MLTEDGTLFHIDFGFILGDDSRFFRGIAAPARLNLHQVTQVLSEEDTQNAFYKTMRLGFNILRCDVHLLLQELSLAAEFEIDPSSSSEAFSAAFRFLEERCQVGISDDIAADKIEFIARRCAIDKTQFFRDKKHEIALKMPQGQVLQTCINKVAEMALHNTLSISSTAVEVADVALDLVQAQFHSFGRSRDGVCSICGASVAGFVKVIASREGHGRRHHCRGCQGTLCHSPKCSIGTGAQRRCTQCVMQDDVKCNRLNTTINHTEGGPPSFTFSPPCFTV